MKPILLIVNDNPPVGAWPAWHTVWCASATADINNAATNEIVVMPEKKISTLCKALYALASIHTEMPVALITDDRWLLPSPETATAQAYLSEQDRGMLFFPVHQQFVLSAQNAIREHNPEWGNASLLDCWHQASILGLDREDRVEMAS